MFSPNARVGCSRRPRLQLWGRLLVEATIVFLNAYPEQMLVVHRIGKFDEQLPAGDFENRTRNRHEVRFAGLDQNFSAFRTWLETRRWRFVREALDLYGNWRFAIHDKTPNLSGPRGLRGKFNIGDHATEAAA